MEINELWEKQYIGEELDGKTVLIQGDAIVDPRSDFRFNAFYLVDSQTPLDQRDPTHAFWFGVGIADSHCEIGAQTMTCQPFNPQQAKTFQFKGVLHLTQVGKRRVMWLSEIDFAQSRQFVNGEWQLIPLGVFEIPIEEK